MRGDGSGVTLKEERTKGASALSGVGLVDWCTVGGGVDGAVRVVEDVLRRHGGEVKEEKGSPFFIYPETIIGPRRLAGRVTQRKR